MRNADSVRLSRQTCAFIVLVALLQALLLYLADLADTHLWWWLSTCGPRVFWFTLILAVPTLLILSVQRLDDARFWQHALGAAVVYALLASWAAWSATGAPGIEVGAVLWPFGVTVGIALFVALPFLQCRLDEGRWRAAYPVLFDHAWQNGLTLVVAGLFTGLCWLVLLLWANLFDLVHVRFFHELFFREKSFAYLATGLFAGLGILIGRTQRYPLKVAREVLFAICRGLLPLVALIALLFLASLPFTGLAPLWATRSAAALLLGLLVVLVVFANAVWQDGADFRPYPRLLRWPIDAALVLAPLYAALALYAIALRVGQYGWTHERFWAMVAAVLLGGYALGYAAAALRRTGAWLAWLPRVNIALAVVVMAAVVLVNSPALDPYRITVASQLGRLHAGHTPPAAFDAATLRFANGRRGYRAAVALRQDPAMRADPQALASLQRTIEQQVRVGYGYARRNGIDQRAVVASVDALRAAIALAPGAHEPDAPWYRALLDGSNRDLACVLKGADCVVLTPELRGGGEHQILLCDLGREWLVGCVLFTRGGSAGWRRVGGLDFAAPTPGLANAVRQALRAGTLQVSWPYWPDLKVAGVRARLTGDAWRDDGPATPASSGGAHP